MRHADLADQLRRAAQSVPQNIAEGCGRTTRADKARHYTIARGSAMESASHLDVMRVDELIDADLYARGVELLERIVAMLTKLIDPCASTASIMPTTAFPFTSEATITITITITMAMVSEPGARHCQSCAGNMGIEAASARAPHAPG